MFRTTGKWCRDTSPGQIRPQSATAALAKLIPRIISSRTFNQTQYKRSYLSISGTLNFTAPGHYCSLPVYTAAIRSPLFPSRIHNLTIPSTKFAIPLAPITTQQHPVAELHKIPPAFPTKTPYTHLLSPLTRYMPRPSHPSPSDEPINILSVKIRGTQSYNTRMWRPDVAGGATATHSHVSAPLKSQPMSKLGTATKIPDL